jgi:hypothetical protein
MAKRQTRRKGPIQTILDRDTVEQNTAPLVNPFAEQHGDYARNLRFVVNRGGTAIDRWKRDKSLSDSQLAGILHCQHLWAKLGSQSVVVDFNRVRGQPHGAGYSQHEAFTELARISGGFPYQFWSVFENVCRHDLPAGVAGSRLSNNKRSAIDAARLIVCFIADLISMRERLSY